LLLAAQGHLEDAETALQQALGHHAILDMPFEWARTMLSLGIVQRRRKHRAAAAGTLRQSHDTFVGLGCPIWAKKARAEEARIGARSRSQSSLSPIEERIALLASQGRNNREIADLLYVSRKTVESNLTHIYRKLGIHSRAQLGTALNKSGNQPAST
jgi:DNA-binding CsgD family transcriptional regulator